MGLVTLLPMAFMQRTWFFRILALVMVGIFAVCLGNWMRIRYGELDPKDFFRLQGDAMVQDYPQSKRIVQVLKSMHGKVILPGKSYWDYNAAPAIVAFSENYCYVAYYFQEDDSGNGDEAEYRSKLNNDFYDGKMADPMPFLLSNNISAVLIWTEDNISDAQLQKFQQQLGSQFYYIDCKMGQPNNAGRVHPPRARPDDGGAGRAARAAESRAVAVLRPGGGLATQELLQQFRRIDRINLALRLHAEQAPAGGEAGGDHLVAEVAGAVGNRLEERRLQQIHTGVDPVAVGRAGGRLFDEGGEVAARVADGDAAGGDVLAMMEHDRHVRALSGPRGSGRR